MKYITILDFEVGKVFQYFLETWGNSNNWNPDSESIEDYLISKGHNLTNCEWMVHKSSTIYSLTKEDDVVNTN